MVTATEYTRIFFIQVPNGVRLGAPSHFQIALEKTAGINTCMDPTNLLTISQAAAHCGVEYHTIRRWTLKNGLKATTIANKLVVDRRDLEKFLEDSASWRRESLTISRRERRAA